MNSDFNKGWNAALREVADLINPNYYVGYRFGFRRDVLALRKGLSKEKVRLKRKRKKA